MSCSVQLSFRDGEPESLFEPSQLLSALSSSIPRFGKTDNLRSAWIEEQDTTGYVVGVIACCIILTIVLLLWALGICLCKRAGSAWVGLWSGRVPKTRDPPMPPEMLFPQNQMASFISSQSIATSRGGPGQSVQVTNESRPDSNSAPNHIKTKPIEGENGSRVVQKEAAALFESAPGGKHPSRLESLLPSTSLDHSADSSNFSLLLFPEDDSFLQAPSELGARLPDPPEETHQVLSESDDLEAGCGAENDQKETLVEKDVEANVSNASLSEDQEKGYLTVDVSGVVMEPLLGVSTPSSVKSSASTASKYEEFMKYLDEATSSRKLISNPNDDDDETNSSKDSDDWLLDAVLADEPSYSVRIAPPVAERVAVDTTTKDDSVCFQANNESRKEELNLSFPIETPEEGFLFEDDDEDAKFAYEDDTDQPTATSTLPQSKFSSQAASRKRLLENYVKGFKNASNCSSFAPQSAMLVTDDSELLSHSNLGLVVRQGLHLDAQKSVSGSLFQGVNSSEVFGGVIPREIVASNTQPTERSSSTTSDGEEGPEIKAPSEISQRSVSSIFRNNARLVQTTTGPGPYTDDEVYALYDFRRKHEMWVLDQRRVHRRLHQFRSLVVLAATILIVCTLLFGLNGVWNLDWQRQRMQESWRGIQASTMQLTGYLDELVTLQASASQQLSNVWQLLDQHCPLIRENNCPSLSSEVGNFADSLNATCNLTNIPLANQWQEWLEVYVHPQYIETKFLDAEDWSAVSLDAEVLAEQPVEEYLGSWNWGLWAALTCNTLLSILVFAILAGIALPEAESLHKIISSWPFAAIYWTSVFLAWVFGVGFIIATVLTVDSCTAVDDDGVESPATLAKILFDRIETSSGLTEYWDYIADGCPAENYPTLVDDRVWAWSSLLPSIIRLSNGLETYPDSDFMETCGTPIESLRDAAETLSSQFCMVTQSLANIRRVLGCDQWYPWYESISNESLCSQGSTSLAWIS